MLPRFVVPFRRFLPTGELKLAQPGGGFNPDAAGAVGDRVPIALRPKRGTVADRLLEAGLILRQRSSVVPQANELTA